MGYFVILRDNSGYHGKVRDGHFKNHKSEDNSSYLCIVNERKRGFDGAV
jgi:hypothetical protein